MEEDIFFVLCFLLVRNQFYSFFFFTLWHFKLVLIINRGHAHSEKANGK